MQLHEILAQAQNGRAIDNLAQACGVPADRMTAVVNVVATAFAENIERNTLSRGGLADFVTALGDGHHEYILDDPRTLNDPRVRIDGNEILEHVLGPKDRSRALAATAARASGLSEGLIKMLLPIIAQWVMGAISKWARGNLGDVIARIPGAGSDEGDGTARGDAGGRRRGPLPRDGGFELPRSQVPKDGYPMPPIPRDDGDPAPSEDRWGNGRSAGGPVEGGGNPFPVPFPWPSPSGEDERHEAQVPWPRRREQRERQPSGGTGGFDLPQSNVPQGPYPLPPIPGETRGGSDTAPRPIPRQPDNPYGDLSDILRRGGRIEGAPAGRTIRDMLGGLLGFGGTGLVGWLVRLIVVRFGWNLLRRLLGRALPGR